MSVDPKLGALPDALVGLVAAERRAPAAPAGDRARVWAAIAANLPGPGTGGPSDPEPGAGGTSEPGGGTTGPGGSPVPGPAAGGATAAASATRGALPWVAAVAAIGAGVSIFVATRSPSAPPSPPAYVASAPSQATPPVPAPIEPVREPAPPPAPVTPEPAAAPPARHAPASRTRDVSRPARPAAPAGQPAADVEDVLIERAKLALARTRFDEALALLMQHERRFPNGALRGRRELLIVRALLGRSDRAGATARAERLRRADPDDPSLPAIDAALAR